MFPLCRILNATNNLGVVLQFGEGETDMRFVSGGLALEVWDISNQSLGSTPVIGIKSLVNEDNEDLELVTQFAENEINYNDTEAAIYLPQNILKNFTSNENNSVRLVLNVYKDTRLYKQATGQDVNQIDGALNSRVIAAQLLVNGEQVTDFRGHKVLTVFEPTRSIEFGEERKYKNTCAYWNYSANYGLGAWSTTGCELNKTVEGRVVCQWNHLTNFAIYLSFREQSQLEHREILGIITKIGLSLSIIGIVGFMLSFLCIRKLRARLMWKVMFQLSLALLLSSIVFLTGIEQTSDYGSCIAVAVILHYLVLVSFMCMLVDAILQYLMFVKRMNKEQILSYGNFWWKTALPCWGLPVIPVIIILAIDHHLYRGGTHYCWLKLQAFYWGFALPLTLILLTNFIIFVRVSMKMCCREDMTASSTRKDNQILVNIRMSIFCFTMLGLTWVFGFFAIEDARLGFQYLFSITSSLQGFIMFVLTTARDAKIRKYWIEKVSSCLHLKQEVVLPSSITGTAGRKRKMFTGTPTTRATNTTFADRTPKTSNTSMSVINGASSGLHGSHPWVRTPKTSNTSMSVINGVSSGSCSSNPLVRTPAQVHEHGGDQIHTAGTHSG
ncbi:G-protein coupled receptor [Plakobranchus ocellatus]|uniref:G-protein coupled receptor n=1 Tax=Plakobranchus ocellatus TaxID=259542 RepID=A0AAV4BKV2_9GAST|nr:G-protein coupled receptor [Plakobranchus ocellatus]